MKNNKFIQKKYHYYVVFGSVGDLERLELNDNEREFYADKINREDYIYVSRHIFKVDDVVYDPVKNAYYLFVKFNNGYMPYSKKLRQYNETYFKKESCS